MKGTEQDGVVCTPQSLNKCESHLGHIRLYFKACQHFQLTE